ncbi:endolytic transglycosylase MltG, partial [Microvirga sp. 3-52]|nr:endolytic transglycosylase MltG [Microvirga sp. 3-52]
IDAVIDPESTDYLYFLADKDGENHFSKTYEEHLAKRAKYIDKK